MLRKQELWYNRFVSGRHIIRWDLIKPLPKYKPEKNFHQRKAERIANRGKKMKDYKAYWEERDKKYQARQEKVKALLQEIGQEMPPCGFDVGSGWEEPVFEALRKMAKVGIPWQLAQVKQKFCQLRIYIDVDTPGDVTPENHDSIKNPWIWEEAHPLKSKYDELHGYIGEAEVACNIRCEECGAQTEGGPASGWKGCTACKEAERKEFGED